MKINNVGNINALSQDAAKALPLDIPVLKEAFPQSSQTASVPPSTVQPHLSQLISLLNLFPLLHQQKAANPTFQLLTTLINTLTPPLQSTALARWMAEGRADSALLKALTALTQHDDEAPPGLKGLLLLLAEQRFNEQSKSADYHWLFPSRNPDQNPIRVSVKKKQTPKHKKQVWSVTVNLSLTNNRHLTATAELTEKNVSLTFATDSEGLHEQLEKAMPALENALASHHIQLSSYDVNFADNVVSTTVNSGVNIQV